MNCLRFIKYWCYRATRERQNPRTDNAATFRSAVVAILLAALDAATGDAVGGMTGVSVGATSSCGACDGAGVSGP